MYFGYNFYVHRVKGNTSDDDAAGRGWKLFKVGGNISSTTGRPKNAGKC